MTDGERSSIDDVIDVYKRDVDRTLIRQRLTRSIEERLEDLMELQRASPRNCDERDDAPPRPMTDFKSLLRALTEGGVEFILVGGAAATVHGSSRAVDVVYRRACENFTRLAAALAAYQPYLRGAPPGLPFRWDVPTIEHGLNFTLTTQLGDLNVLGEIVGGGGYDALLASTSLIRAFDVECRCLNLDRLIEVKRAAGRPMDLEALAELEAIREERSGTDRAV